MPVRFVGTFNSLGRAGLLCAAGLPCAPVLLCAAVLSFASLGWAQIRNEVGAKAASPAASEAAPFRVVLVTNHADARIMPLLKAELQALGLEVVVVDHAANEVVPRDLGVAARETNSLAGFRVIVAEGSVEVWIADRVTGKVILREALEQDTASKGAESVVVLRAVELLRVSLMELEAPHEPRGEVTAPPEIQDIAGFPEGKGRYALELGAGVGLMSMDLPPVPAAHLGFRIKLGRWFQYGVSGRTDLTTSEVSEEEGSASVGTTGAGAFFGLNRANTRALLQPALRGGPGIVWTRIRGDSDGDLPEFSHNVISPTVSLEAFLAFRTSQAFRLWVGVGTSALFGRPAVDVGGERAVSFLPATTRAAAGIQIAWP